MEKPLQNIILNFFIRNCYILQGKFQYTFYNVIKKFQHYIRKNELFFVVTYLMRNIKNFNLYFPTWSFPMKIRYWCNDRWKVLKILILIVITRAWGPAERQQPIRIKLCLNIWDSSYFPFSEGASTLPTEVFHWKS